MAAVIDEDLRQLFDICLEVRIWAEDLRAQFRCAWWGAGMSRFKLLTNSRPERPYMFRRILQGAGGRRAHLQSLFESVQMTFLH